MDLSSIGTDEDMGFFRLIANPHRLKPDHPPPNELVHKSTLEYDIERVIRSEYSDVYVNAYLIDRIKRVIQKEMSDYVIDIVVSDLVSDLAESCTEQ